MAIHHEGALEAELCDYLAAHGWDYSTNDHGYDRDRALFPADVFAWLEATQPEQLDKLVKPGAPDASRELGRKQILDRIVAAQSNDTMNGGGTLNVLKASVSVLNAKFSLFQKRPANELNPKTLDHFAANRLRVMRQVRYSGKSGNRIDLVLFVNGIPVSTIELKTDLTQDLAAGLKQYAQDRKPAGEPLLTFGRGALVHFVVTNEEVHMTTKLDGTSTRVLPSTGAKAMVPATKLLPARALLRTSGSRSSSARRGSISLAGSCTTAARRRSIPSNGRRPTTSSSASPGITSGARSLASSARCVTTGLARTT